MIVQKGTLRNSQDYSLFALAERRANGRPWCIITSSEVVETLALDGKQVARLMTRLVSKGRIQKLQRGVYVFPGKIPPGKVWKPSPYVVLSGYLGWLGATWQISGVDAFTKHGFSTQMAQKIFVYNDKLSGEKEIGGTTFILAKVPKRHLGNTIEFEVGSLDVTVIYSSKARSVFDAFYEHSRFKSLPKAYEWILALRKGKNFIQELIDCCIKYGNKATRQRIGFILASLDCKNKKMASLKKMVGQAPALISLVPPFRTGKIDSVWGVIISATVAQMINSEGLA